MTPHTPASGLPGPGAWAAAIRNHGHADPTPTPVSGELLIDRDEQVISRNVREQRDLRPATDRRHPSTPGSETAGLPLLPVTQEILDELGRLGLPQPLSLDQIYAATAAASAARHRRRAEEDAAWAEQGETL